MTPPSFDELQLLYDQMCKAIGDPRRLQIIYALKEEPMYVTQLADALDMPQSTVSRHLAVLRDRNIVLTERDGAAVCYSLADPRLTDAIDLMRQILHDALMRQAGAIS